MQESHALMESLFPSESNHYLSIDDLDHPDIRFFVALSNGEVVGCGAVALKLGFGEVKSMFTDSHARGLGVAAAILKALEDAARVEKLPLLRLETGGALETACRLYERHGFVRRAAFGDYPDDPLSVFYEKAL